MSPNDLELQPDPSTTPSTCRSGAPALDRPQPTSTSSQTPAAIDWSTALDPSDIPVRPSASSRFASTISRHRVSLASLTALTSITALAAGLGIEATHNNHRSSERDELLKRNVTQAEAEAGRRQELQDQLEEALRTIEDLQDAVESLSEAAASARSSAVCATQTGSLGVVPTVTATETVTVGTEAGATAVSVPSVALGRRGLGSGIGTGQDTLSVEKWLYIAQSYTPEGKSKAEFLGQLASEMEQTAAEGSQA